MKKLFWFTICLGLALAVYGLWPKKVKDLGPPAKVEASIQQPKQNDNQISVEDQEDLDHLAKLEKFFTHYKCKDPDNNIAGNYLEYAYEYGIDWRLLPAISIQESTCGQHQLYNNWWGFGSSTGLMHFKNIYYGMDYIMDQLRNATPYHGKSETEILQNYGPHIPDPNHPGKYIPSLTYYKEVLRLIGQIDQ